MSSAQPISQHPVVVEITPILVEKRRALGYGVELVRSRLMLSEQQIWGLENGKTASFYNDRLFLRALKKYAVLLGYNGPCLPALDELIKAQSASQVEREIDQSLNGQSNVVTQNLQPAKEKYIFFSIIVLILVAVLIVIGGFRI